MTLDINERRKRLREALADADTGDVSGFVAAFAGASEEDRATLARTLPAAKLFKAEGPTPRACFVLAALGKPAVVGETSYLWTSRQAREKKILRGTATMMEFFLAAAHDRDRAWQLAFIDALAEGDGWILADRTWPLARALIEAHALAPESENYLGWFLSYVRQDGKKGAAKMAALLTESNGILFAEFWAIFRVEGMGSHFELTNRNNGDAWLAAIAILCDTMLGFRDRILDESLGALLRDFSANNTTWYLRVHRDLDPTPEEIAARAGTYESLLAAGPSTTVGLAQDMLTRAIDRIAPNALLDASAGVLGRSEKKLLTAQIKLLAALVKARPERAAQVSELVASLDVLPADVAVAARKLILLDQAAASVYDTKVDSTAPAGAPITVPEPRRTAIPHEPDQLTPVTNEDELWELVSASLEGVGHGRDLARILDYLSHHADLVAGPPVLARAAEVMTSVLDWAEFDGEDAAPRRHLSDLLLSRARQQSQQITYRGYRRHLRRNRTRDGAVVDSRGFSYMPVPTGVPTALLVDQFHASAGQVAIAPLPAAAREWKRAMLRPGKGNYLDQDPTKPVWRHPKPVWLPAAETPGATFAGHDFGVGGVQDEYMLRAEEARRQDGFDQIVQWAAWLLSENVDTLAAIYHPVLDAAVRVVNVRGVAVLLAALGETRRVPHGPVWSALALGLSAKMSEHRATAAEAVAALAESGLLDPAPFAAEIAAHLKDELVLAGRLAAALADAASINPIAGYRVLQTLVTLLPHLDGVNQAAKLVELTARIAADYGTPVPIPDALASKRKGSSVMAVALRALDAVTPRATPLAEEAAAQAAASLADPGGRKVSAQDEQLASSD